MSPETGALDEFVFAARGLWPLFFVPLLAILAYGYGRRKHQRALFRLGGHPLALRLVDTVAMKRRGVAIWASLVSMVFLVLALMRPQYGGKAKVVPASGLDIVLVVDYSKSMLAKDVYPNRNERLELELTRFLDDAEKRGDRVGVVVFAGAARGMPVTRDVSVLKLYLDKADPRSENPGGTAIGKALKLALAFLVDARTASESADAGPIDQAIVLMTDGEDTVSKPLEVAAEAAKLGVKIYGVGIGSTSGEPVQKFDEQGEPAGFVTDKDGNYVMTRIDEALLQELGRVTGGSYIRVEADAFGLDRVRLALEGTARSQREDTIEIHRQEGFGPFAWTALAGLLVSLVLPERRKKI